MAKKTETKNTDWIKMKPAELEKLVAELHKEGNSPAKIGIILRDKHGIPRAKLLGKRISQMLKEAKLTVESPVIKMEQSKENLEKHIAKNKHDYTALKSLHKKLWDINRAKKQIAIQ